MDRIRAILFGMTGFGNNALEVLLKHPSIKTIAVFTPEKEAGPFPYYECEKLQDAVLRSGIALYEGLHFEGEKTYDIIKKLSPELIVVSSFNQIVPKSIISIPQFGIINIHPSLLPKYRGATPTVWALLNGEEEAGVTAHFIEDEKIDCGRIIKQAKLRIEPSDTDGTLRFKLAKLSEHVLVETLNLFPDIDKKMLPITDESAYYPKRTLKDAEIDIHKPFKKILYRIKAMTPYPGAFVKYNGKSYTVISAELLKEQKTDEVFKSDNKHLVIKTREGVVKFYLKGHTVMNAQIEHVQDSYGIRPDAQEFPMMCVLSFVYVCNAKCPYCPYTNSEIRFDYRDRPFMNEDTFKIIATQCGEYGAWVRLSGGGEPMLHPKAVELMEYAKKVGGKVGLITNGSRFTEENTKRLLEAGVDMIEFSVDAADEKAYARVRKGLDWETLLKNVCRMVELRDKLKSPSKIIASGVNQGGVDIDAVAKFWEPIVDNFQRRKYLTWGINDPSKSADSTPYLPPDQMIPCPFLFERLNIDSRGKVMVCGFDIEAATDMGNVHEKTIKEIWHGEGFEYYRQKHLSKKGDDMEMCKNCPDWKYRSWKHNYWKVVRNAEDTRKGRTGGLDIQDM